MKRMTVPTIAVAILIAGASITWAGRMGLSVKPPLEQADALAAKGKTAEAARLYEKVLNASRRTADAPRRRARASLLRLYAETLAEHLEKAPDGEYVASVRGYMGPVKVAVTVKDHRIGAVRVLEHKESRPGAAPTQLPAAIVEKQGLKGVDAVTGATVSSRAILAAAGKAVAAAAAEREAE